MVIEKRIQTSRCRHVWFNLTQHMSGDGKKELLWVYTVEKIHEIIEKATQCHTSQSSDQV